MVQYPTSAELLNFPSRSKDWTQQELAEFYRVESALTRSGLSISSERGLSDEGDPWFIFYRDNDHEPIVHFARIDGLYIIASVAYDGIVKGTNFREMILDLLSRHGLKAQTISRNSNVFFHPAALLITLVGVAFFKAPSSAKAEDALKNGLTPDKSGALIPSLTKTAVPHRFQADAQTQPTTSPFNIWSEEVTSVLLLAIADLPLMPSAASARNMQTLPKPQDSGVSSNELTALLNQQSKNHTFDQLTASNVDQTNHQDQVDNGPGNPSAKIIDNNALISDATSLMQALNSIPVSSTPNNLETLSMLARQAVSDKLVFSSAASFSHTDDGAAIMFTRATMSSETFKYSSATTLSTEKEQKASNVEQPKTAVNSTHQLDSTTSSNLSTVNPNELQGITAKISLGELSNSALTIINQLDKTFHFADSSGNSSIKINTNQISTGENYSSPNDVQGARINSGTPQEIYTFVVQEDAILKHGATGISSQSSNQTSAGQSALASNHWNGQDVGNLLTKFLEVFTNAHFALASEKEFVFQTDSSQMAQGMIEKITINFQDGSHINIIGQKGEIDSLMGMG